MIVVFSFGPVVRGKLQRYAAIQGLRLEIESVRPNGFGIALHNVLVEPLGDSLFRLETGLVEIRLSSSLEPRNIAIRGGELTLSGSLERFNNVLRSSPSGSHNKTAHIPITASELRVRWASDQNNGGADGVELQRTETVIAAKARSLSGTWLSWTASANDLTLMHASGLGWQARVGTLALGPADGAAAPHGPANAEPNAAAIPSMERVRILLATLDEQFPGASRVEISAFTLRRAGQPEAGPVGIAVARGSDSPELTLTLPGSTPFIARVQRQTDGVLAELSGGPALLPALGTDVVSHVSLAGAQIAGDGHFVLGRPHELAALDGRAELLGVSVQHAALASTPLVGVHLSLRGRVTVDSTWNAKLEEATLGLGALKVLVNGNAQFAIPSGQLHFAVPATSCQQLFESMPAGLLPTLRGTRFEGTFGLQGDLFFDGRNWDALDLHYDVRDACKVVATPPDLAKERLLRPFLHKVYRPDGTIAEQRTGPGTAGWTQIGAISPNMRIAVLTTEDGGFFRHRGFSHGAIRSSLIANLKAGRFIRGASTITMQLAKNLFLGREKTVARKLEEIVLVDYLEQVFTKDEILELYFNIVEFGPNLYGIGPASYHYFGRSPGDLSLPEAFFLASILPSPLKLHGLRASGVLPVLWQRTLNVLMTAAQKSGHITEEELEDAKAEPVVFQNTGPRPVRRPKIPEDVEWHEAN
jgi:hypothetical protein